MNFSFILRYQKILPYVIILFGIFVAISWYGFGTYDFRAFYCAGASVNHGIDPYRLEFLQKCEGNYGTIPAPLPGYDLFLSSLLAHLPYSFAVVIDLALLTVAYGLTIFLLHKTTGVSLFIIGTVLYLSSFMLGIQSGQIVSFVLLFLSFAMYFVQKECYWLSGLFLLGTLIEPHLGIGCVIASFLFLDRTRFVLGFGLFGLLALSFFTIGKDVSIEYIISVLPKHAMSEIHQNGQLSLTHILFLLGWDDRTSLFFGSVSYIFMLFFGISVSSWLFKKTGDRTFILVIPIAMSVIAGSYIHVIQMAVAIPAILLFYKYSKNEVSFLSGLSLVLLAIPWEEIHVLNNQVILVGAVVAIAIKLVFLQNLKISILIGSFVSIVLLCISPLLNDSMIFDAARSFHSTVSSTGFVDDEWRQYVEVIFTHNSVIHILLAIPTWIGLIAFFYVALLPFSSKIECENV